MPRAGFNEKHTIILDRVEENGAHVFHELQVQIPRSTVEAAEQDDALSQEDVIDAFTVRFRRRFPSLPVPEDIYWSHFQHPILPTVQSRP
jgi:hypothetical protein